MMPRYAVLGAGHGGMAMAGHLGLMGFDVTLWNRNSLTLCDAARIGGIWVEGEVEGFGPVQVCDTVAEAVDGADLVLVVVPASAHAEVARLCAPVLKDGQMVLLMPGRTGGAIEFSATLRRSGSLANVTIGEAQTFIYASRRVGPAQARIHGIKRQVLAAALPAFRTHDLMERIWPAFPQFLPAKWVLKTSLDNIGAIFHPAVVLLNTARIESTGGAFRHYADGITPSVAALLEQLDGERIAVARALGVGALSAREWLSDVYGVEAPTLFEAIQATPAYYGVGAPPTLETRYIWEDVPTGLVPLSSLGDLLGVPTPTIDMVTDLACRVCGYDFRRHGRTLERLGLEGWSPEEIKRLALEGDVINLV